ncbi:DUF6318 family protein [Ornithinimicrobium sp. W1665]|uniref:DUF6318 family protein n=1 Tax=Ornithinimicrobium sp. W1665 TaxID=3416666 RepID=UPI003CF47ACF
MSALLTLSACDTSGEPSAPPTSEDSLTTATAEPAAPADDTEVTTEPEPTSEEPTEEAAPALDQTEQGAEAFVEHYMEELNDAFVTGEGGEVIELSTADCQSCSELVADAEANPAGEALFQTSVDTVALMGSKARVEAEIQEAGEVTPAVFELSWQDRWKVEAIKIGQR